jgi:hypothetical protein
VRLAIGAPAAGCEVHEGLEIYRDRFTLGTKEVNDLISLPFSDGSLETGSENWQDQAIVSPTIFQSGPYRVFFFSSDRAEPPHVHIVRERKLAKFWLGPVTVATNIGFGMREIQRLARLVTEHETRIRKAWHEYFGIPDESGGASGARH